MRLEIVTGTGVARPKMFPEDCMTALNASVRPADIQDVQKHKSDKYDSLCAWFDWAFLVCDNPTVTFNWKGNEYINYQWLTLRRDGGVR